MARTQASVHQQPFHPQVPEDPSHPGESRRGLRLVPTPSLMAPPEDDPAKPPQQDLDNLQNPEDNAKPPQQDLDKAKNPDPDPPSD